MFAFIRPRFVDRLLSRAKRRTLKNAKFRPCRLALEQLEDRTLLAVISPIGGPPPAGPPAPPTNPSSNGPFAASVSLGFMFDEATPLNVLQYDTDPNMGATLDPTTITIVKPPSFGQALPDPNTGMIVYTPNTLPATSNLDSFQYTVTDSLGLTSNVATISLTAVAPTSTGFIVPPTLTVDTVTLQPVTIDVLPGVQINDGSTVIPNSIKILGVANDPGSSEITGGVQGSLAINLATDVITFTPNFGFVGYQDIRYSMSDTAGHTGMADLLVGVFPTVARVQTDPLGGTMLVVDGTGGNDTINVYPAAHDCGVMVNENGVVSGPFHPTSRIVVFSYGGNNKITVSSDIKLPSWLVGGDGNNVLVGGGGNNVLIGGTGNDVLVGGGNRDLIISGGGKSVIVGSSGGDIVISGTTSFDDSDVVLAALMSEWTSNQSYQQRIDDLTDVSNRHFAHRLNGDYFLNSSTVQSSGIHSVVDLVSNQNLLLLNKSSSTADTVDYLSHKAYVSLLASLGISTDDNDHKHHCGWEATSTADRCR